MKCYVLGFYLTPDGVVMIKKRKPTWQAGKWNGIGGSIEAGETPIQAMVREFREEAQLRTLESQWTQLFTLSGNAFGNAEQPWEMAVFLGRTEGSVRDMYPLTMDEGTVDVVKAIPQPIDSTAAWLLPMCWDLARHRIAVSKAGNVAAIAEFYRRVCQRAERNMELTGVLEGAHWNALRQEMAALGIETK